MLRLAHRYALPPPRREALRRQWQRLPPAERRAILEKRRHLREQRRERRPQRPPHP